MDGLPQHLIKPKTLGSMTARILPTIYVSLEVSASPIKLPDGTPPSECLQIAYETLSSM